MTRMFLAMAAVLISAVVVDQPATARTAWPNGRRSVVVLTYDDALQSQLDTVVPALDETGLTATFFLSGVRQVDIPRWRAVAARENELANHTIFHPCSAASFPAEPRFTNEAYSPSTMLREIEQQNVLLTAIDGRERHGFATPCGQTSAGGVDYLEPLRRSGLVTYARGVSESAADLKADVSRIDPMHVPARGFGEGTTAAQLIDFAQQAQAGGGMAVYLFHGVGGDNLRVSASAHRALLDWLKAQRSAIWVTTLQNAMDWAKAHPGPP